MSSVRAHYRKINGVRVPVIKHNRAGEAGGKSAGKGRGKQKKSLARRAWGNVKNAWKAGRRKQKWMCAGFVALAAVELGAFLGLNALAFAAVSVGVLAIGTATVAVSIANAGGK